jgi:dimethylhistidine N-methyltransferase
MSTAMSSLAPRTEKFGAETLAARRELAAGLGRSQATISPKYFYDALGSKLFEAICQLDEYYLTRTEAEIFAANALDIAQVSGPGTTMIDLGAGNCEKAAGLFTALRPAAYVPVDISVDFLVGAVETLRQKHPHIPMQPVGLDFSTSLVLPDAVQRASKKLFFYPGSSLGNFSPLQAAQFLQRLRSACNAGDGAILLGIDLAKSADTLEAAYDDALGVTAAFNMNVLRHVNRILGSDFASRGWQHVALFNAAQSRIEMHLQARHDLTVAWPGGSRNFAAGERIHTENSYKYTSKAVLDLLTQAGFGDIRCWSDSNENYLVCHAGAI